MLPIVAFSVYPPFFLNPFPTPLYPMPAASGSLANITATAAEITALDNATNVIRLFFESCGIDVLTADEFSEYDKVDNERWCIGICGWT